MPKLTYTQDENWSNFHLTRMGMTIQNFAKIDASDIGPGSGLERFATTGAALFDHLRTLHVPAVPGGGPVSFAAGTTGKAWSFSALVGTPVSQLDAAGLSGTDMLQKSERDQGCPLQADFVALTSGGTSLFDLATWAEGRNRTIHTSGTFLVPTIAGSFGTSSHGSRIGYGGIQEMVLGMHLIVGRDEHVWIERASAPVLSVAGLAKLAIGGKSPRLVRDDDRFEDALVHLGGMGIVNGVAIGLVANDRYSVMRRVTLLTPAFLKAVAASDFTAIGKLLDCGSSPDFYELTINPHKLFNDAAMNTMYFRSNRVPLTPAGPLKMPRLAEVVFELGDKMLTSAQNAPPFIPNGKKAMAAASPATVPSWVFSLLINASSVFAYYLGLKQFDMPNTYFDPDDPQLPIPYRWSEMHPGAITGGKPGALYNASFALPVERLDVALPLICKAVQKLAPSFVFTVRFVDKADGTDGTLAFTRFEKNAVIEIDGLSPLVCIAAKAQVNPDLSYARKLKAALDVLAGTVPEGAKLVRKALHDNGIPYSMHWAKLGGLDKAKVYADYGHPRDCESLTHRWCGTRDMLLTPFGKRIFWNQALIDYGLVDP